MAIDTDKPTDDTPARDVGEPQTPAKSPDDLSEEQLDDVSGGVKRF